MTMIETEQPARSKRRKRPYTPGIHNKRPIYVCGIALSIEADGGTRASRRLKALIRGYVSEIGRELSDADRDRVVNAALIAMQLEHCSRSLSPAAASTPFGGASGLAINPDLWTG